MAITHQMVNPSSLKVGDVVLLDNGDRTITRITSNRQRITVYYFGQNNRTGAPKERSFTFWGTDKLTAWVKVQP